MTPVLFPWTMACCGPLRSVEMMKEELEADGGSAIEEDGISMGVDPRTEPGWVDEEK